MMIPPRTGDDWPACSGCGQRRQTICPSCGMAGARFPQAEYLAEGEPLRGSRQLPPEPLRDSPLAANLQGPDQDGATEGERIWLVCPQCDEVFQPQFYRHCPACEWDEGWGIEPRSAAAEFLPTRVLWAVALLAALCGLLLLYFWFLFRGA